MRNEIRELMMECGCPSFYLTINPADVYSPILKFLSGEQLDLDAMTKQDVPRFWEQSSLVARNPVVASKFFNVYMHAFIDCILGWDDTVQKGRDAILGRVKAFYGCVEEQGRGSLHCHMLVWMIGGMNPNKIRDHIFRDKDKQFAISLLSYLDDAISTAIPTNPDALLNIPSSDNHPCAVQGEEIYSFVPGNKERHLKDLHNLAMACQLHMHTHTCYKY